MIGFTTVVDRSSCLCDAGGFNEHLKEASMSDKQNTDHGKQNAQDARNAEAARASFDKAGDQNISPSTAGSSPRRPAKAPTRWLT